ncbi:MAG: hypothetical protein AB1611_11245 [bacterium]
MEKSVRKKPALVFLWYVNARFPVWEYGVYAALWFCSLLAGFALFQDKPADAFCSHFRAGSFAESLAGIVCVYGLFLFMRTVDEIKDLEYDRQFKPDRPLPQGIVTIRDMTLYLAGTSMVVISLSFWIHWKLTIVSIMIMGYSLFLLWLEHASEKFAQTMFLNLMVAIQLKVGAALYVYLFSSLKAADLPFFSLFGLIAAFICAYLQWEIARKICRHKFAAPGEKLYSEIAGTGLSTGISLGFLVTACFMVTVFYANWLFLTPILPQIIGVLLFLKAKDKKFPLGATALAAYLWFLILVLSYAFIQSGLMAYR